MPYYRELRRQPAEPGVPIEPIVANFQAAANFWNFDEQPVLEPGFDIYEQPALEDQPVETEKSELDSEEGELAPLPRIVASPKTTSFIRILHDLPFVASDEQMKRGDIIGVACISMDRRHETFHYVRDNETYSLQLDNTQAEKFNFEGESLRINNGRLRGTVIQVDSVQGIHAHFQLDGRTKSVALSNCSPLSMPNEGSSWPSMFFVFRTSED